MDGHLFVAVSNNGVGPLIIENVEYIKDVHSYTKLNDLLTIDIALYDNVAIADGVVKVLYPGTQLRLFEIVFNQAEPRDMIKLTCAELSLLTIQISAKDIYENKITIIRNLEWFDRHVKGSNCFARVAVENVDLH